MKRLIGVVFFLLMAVFVSANDNNMQMITYFPVPYMHYPKLDVSDRAEVGFRGNGGLWAIDKITAEQLNVQSGTLSLAEINTITAETVTSGSGVNSSGELNFTDAAQVGAVSGTLNSIEAGNTTLQGLKFKSVGFPICDAPDHTISWQQLTIGDVKGMFLVCGEGVIQCPEGQELQEDGNCGCPEGKTWNETTQQCEDEEIKCLIKDVKFYAYMFACEEEEFLNYGTRPNSCETKWGGTCCYSGHTSQTNPSPGDYEKNCSNSTKQVMLWDQQPDPEDFQPDIFDMCIMEGSGYTQPKQSAPVPAGCGNGTRCDACQLNTIYYDPNSWQKSHATSSGINKEVPYKYQVDVYKCSWNKGQCKDSYRVEKWNWSQGKCERKSGEIYENKWGAACKH